MQYHCIQAHSSMKHLGFHSQINHVESAESLWMFFSSRNTSDMEFQLGQILSNLGSNVVPLHLFSKVSRKILKFIETVRKTVRKIIKYRKQQVLQ